MHSHNSYKFYQLKNRKPPQKSEAQQSQIKEFDLEAFQQDLEIKESKSEEKSHLTPFATLEGREEIFAEAKKLLNSSKDLKSDITEVKENVFAKAVKELYLKRDGNLGINSQYVYRTIEGKPVTFYYRDARKQQPQKEGYHFHEGWAIMGLAFVDAAKKMVARFAPEKEDECKEFFERKVKKFLVAIKKSDNPEFTLRLFFGKHILKKCLIEYVLPKLEEELNSSEQQEKKVSKKISKKVAIKKLFEELYFAKEISSLQIDNLVEITPATIITDEQGEVYEQVSICVPMAGQLDEKTANEYKSIKEYNDSTNEEHLPEWFKKLSKFKRYLVEQDIDAFITNQIPTQMRNLIPELPILRNAAHSRSFIRKKGQTEWTEILDYYHSGHPGNGAVESLKLLTGVKDDDNNKLHVHSLVNPTEGPGVKNEEVRMHRNLKNIGIGEGENRDKNLLYTNTPIQLLGQMYGKSDYYGAEEICAQSKSICRQLKAKEKFHPNFKILSELHAQYDALKNTQSNNLHLAVLAMHIECLTTQVLLDIYGTTEDKKAKIRKRFVHLICCMSGKDRTGTLRQYADVFAAYMYIKQKVPIYNFMASATLDPLATSIWNTLVKTRRIAWYAGGPGGSGGSFGTLGPDQGGEKPGMHDPSVEVLSERTAQFNKKCPKPLPKKQKTKILAAIILSLIGLGLIATGILAIMGVPLFVSAAVAATSFLNATWLGGTAITIGCAGAAYVVYSKVYKDKYHIRSAPYSPHKLTDSSLLSKLSYHLSYFWKKHKRAIIITGGVLITLGVCATGIGVVAVAPALVAAAATVAGHGASLGIAAGVLAVFKGLSLFQKYNKERKILNREEAGLKSSIKNAEAEAKIEGEAKATSGRGFSHIKQELKEEQKKTEVEQQVKFGKENETAIASNTSPSSSNDKLKPGEGEERVVLETSPSSTTVRQKELVASETSPSMDDDPSRSPLTPLIPGATDNNTFRR